MFSLAGIQKTGNNRELNYLLLEKQLLDWCTNTSPVSLPSHPQLLLCFLDACGACEGPRISLALAVCGCAFTRTCLADMCRWVSCLVWAAWFFSSLIRRYKSDLHRNSFSSALQATCLFLTCWTVSFSRRGGVVSSSVSCCQVSAGGRSSGNKYAAACVIRSDLRGIVANRARCLMTRWLSLR